MAIRMVRPDAKGRITLGALAHGVSSYALTETEDHRIILEPYTEIPVRERWLYDNKTALQKVEQGLKDAADGKVHNRGSFGKFADDGID